MGRGRARACTVTRQGPGRSPPVGSISRRADGAARETLIPGGLRGTLCLSITFCLVLHLGFGGADADIGSLFRSIWPYYFVA